MIEFSEGSSVQCERFGHALHAENVKTSQELHSFYWNIYLLDESASPSDKNSPLIVARLGALQKQVELLFYLTPHHLDRRETSGAISAMVHQWIAPLPLSLLASYHRLKMQQGLLTGAGYDPQTKKKGKYDFSYRDTPEAIQHDPVSTINTFEELLQEEIDKWLKNVHDEQEYPEKNLDLI